MKASEENKKIKKAKDKLFNEGYSVVFSNIEFIKEFSKQNNIDYYSAIKQLTNQMLFNAYNSI